MESPWVLHGIAASQARLETTYFRLLDKSFVMTLVTFILLLAAKYILIDTPSPRGI